MKRREFLKICSAFGASMPVFSAMGCGAQTSGRYDGFDVQFTGKTVVIGAGAAGLAAGYLLDRYGADFEILEARSRIGGRVKRLDGFADFPIDLGGEWIHEHPRVLAALIDDDSKTGSIDVVPYSPESIRVAGDGQLWSVDFGGEYYSEYKFKRTTWFGFLEDHIAPGIQDRIRFDTPVATIDYTGATIQITDASGGVTTADRVIITAPIAVLQSGDITFSPALPTRLSNAIDAVNIPPGIKAFLEFDRKFYPDMLVGTDGGLSRDKLYYDAAFRKDSPRHVLGLFWVADGASAFTDLSTDQDVLDAILAELDALFDGAASDAYLQGVVENWSAEPYTQGAYSFTYNGSEGEIIPTLQEPVDNRLFFAGEAMSRFNTATVPGAMQSAYDAVQLLLES